MRRIVIGVFALTLVVGMLGGVAAASTQPGGDSDHGRHFILVGTGDAFGNFSTTQCCNSNPGDYTVEHFNLTDGGAQPAGSDDDTCLFMFGNSGQHVLCQYAVVLIGRGVIYASGLIQSVHPDGHGGYLPDPFDAAVTGGSGQFAAVRGVIHLTVPDQEHVTYAFALS